MSKFARYFSKSFLVKLTVSTLCILALPSCKEDKRLESEINKTRQEADAYRIQLNTANEEYDLCTKTLVLLRTQQAKNAGASTFDERARKLEVELNALNERKKMLEKNVQRLQQDMEEYKKITA